MNGPALKSLTVDGIPAIAMEKSSDHVSMGESTVIPSGYASFGTGGMIMNQALDMKVNRLPSRTWNWLHMNEAVIDQVMVENENKVTITLPENISQGNITEIDFGKIATGMGEDMDKLASEAHISSLTFETEKDTKIQQPLRLAFHYKDRDRQMNTVDLHCYYGLFI